MFGSSGLNMDSAGPIGVLCSAFAAGYKWKQRKSPTGVLDEERRLAILWNFLFQPILFTLIGFELSFTKMDLQTAGRSLAVLVIGLIFRCLTAYLVCFHCSFNKKEKLFVALAWTPKATVQAALAPMVLEWAENDMSTPNSYRRAGAVILTVAILAILISAPFGAIMIRLTASRLLQNHLSGC
ncbi:hypothetical protein AB6A40_008756 [Gnathostoma spinigerum]|uniref:Cation/H+ exchanger transmembrane domain-containing protein n=1 Tax=Gnathostoma spinigerum TaxID=75299 RepID=A0ABD6ESC9_9BILA